MQFKDAVDIKHYGLPEVIATIVDAHGLSQAIGALQEYAEQEGYDDAAKYLCDAVEELDNEARD